MKNVSLQSNMIYLYLRCNTCSRIKRWIQCKSCS